MNADELSADRLPALLSSIRLSDEEVCTYAGGTDLVGLVAMERLRELARREQGDLGAYRECDLFIQQRGEPADRRMTKIGGRPCRPVEQPWPAGADGVPCRFLCQFNFSESEDLVGQLPGDLLLIFMSSEDYLYLDEAKSCLTFEWQISDKVLHIREGEDSAAPLKSVDAVWHGIRARRRDYVDVSGVEAAIAAEFVKIAVRPVNRGRLALTARELRTHLGMKIGGLPFWFKDDDPEQTCQGDFLCSLSDVVSNPWADEVLRRHGVNVAMPDEGDEFMFVGDFMFYDGFILNFFLNAGGKIDWHLQLA